MSARRSPPLPCEGSFYEDHPPQMIPAAIGFLLFLVGVALASVSAPRYEMLLISSTIAEAGALVCFFLAFRRVPRLSRVLLVMLALIAAQTIIGNILRFFPGLRISDIF